jgi:hypothetical protein
MSRRGRIKRGLRNAGIKKHSFERATDRQTALQASERMDDNDDGDGALVPTDLECSPGQKDGLVTS